MVAPLELWLTWLDEQPPEIGRELVLHLMKLWPGGVLEPQLLLADPTEGFAPRVRRLAGADRATDSVPNLAAMGTTTMLVALTDLVVRERGNPKSWARADAMLDLLEEATEMFGARLGEFEAQVDELTERAKARAPLRERQWARTAESWAGLRGGPLSDTVLDEAYRLARVPGGDGA